MHKQNKLTLNILLVLTLILTTIWGGVILNFVKGKSIAEGERWKDFLYATQTDVREAYSYMYDPDKGWVYKNSENKTSYGHWAANSELTAEIGTNTYSVTWDSNANSSIVKYDNIKDATEETEANEFDIILYFDNSSTGLMYDSNVLYKWDSYHKANGSGDTYSNVEINGETYNLENYTSSDKKSIHYFTYSVEKLYVGSADGTDYYLYLDSDHSIEYKGCGEYKEDSKSITYSNNSSVNTPNNDRYQWEAESKITALENTDVNDEKNNYVLRPSNVVILDNYMNNLDIMTAASTAARADLAGKGTRNINNFYVEFNKMLGTETKDGKTFYKGDTEHLVTSLEIMAYLNNGELSNIKEDANTSQYGVRIKINETQHQTEDLSENATGFTNYYWYDYFDLTNVQYLYGANQTSPIKNAYGLYTLVFNYDVLEWDNSSKKTTGNYHESKVYQFYLTDDTKYVDYPTLNNVAINKSEYYGENEYSTVYYNSDTYNLPTYLFDASKFSVEYEYTSTDDITRTINTSFSLIDKSNFDYENRGTENDKYQAKFGLLSVGGTSYIIAINETQIEYYLGTASTTILNNNNKYGHMTISSSGEYKLYLNNVKKYENGLLIKTGAENTPLSYYFPIVLEELGNYTFENYYLVENGAYNFTVIEPYEIEVTEDGVIHNKSVGIAKNIFKNYVVSTSTTIHYYHSQALQGMRYDENKMLVLKDGFTKTKLSAPAKKLDELDTVLDELDTVEVIKDTSYNPSNDGGYNLVIHGSRVTFSKNHTSTPFRDEKNGIYADITKFSVGTIRNFINGGEGVTDYIGNLTNKSVPLTGVTKNTIPVTNLAPIVFNTYGSLTASTTSPDSKYYRWNKNLTKNENTSGYYFNSEGNLVLNGKPAISSDFTDGTTFADGGLYIVKICSNYAGLTNYYPEGTCTQYFMFVIDNSNPEIYFYTNPEDIDNTKLNSTTKYTNAEKLYFAWEEPNYFQEEIVARISYSSEYIEGNFNATKANYNMGDMISTVTGSEKTPEGYYHIYLYYGAKNLTDEFDRDCIEPRIYVDRTAPEADMMKYETVEDEKGNTVKDKNGNEIIIVKSTNGVNITNTEFVVYAAPKKKSGAQVTAHFAEINFTRTSNAAELIADSIVSTSTEFTPVKDDAISFQLYNLNSFVSYDYGQTLANVSLGSTNSSTPSKLYIFKLTDDAGNESIFYYVFDNSKPRAVYKQERVQGEGAEAKNVMTKVDLDSTSVSEDTQVYWGQYKGIKVKDVDLTSEKTAGDEYSYLKDAFAYINANSQKAYKTLYLNSGYMTLGLANAKVELKEHGAYSTEKAHYITIVSNSDNYLNHGDNPEDWTTTNSKRDYQSFVSTQKTSFTFTISDKLDNKNNNYNLTMDTDQAKLNIFADVDKIPRETKTDESGNTTPSSTPDVAEAHNNTVLKANTIVTYYKKDVAENIVAEVTYKYYPFAQTEYLSTSDEKTDISAFSDDKFYIKSYGTIYPTYPFSKTVFSSGSVPSNANDDGTIDDKAATPLNAITQNGESVSQEGLYILTRVYKNTTTNAQLSQEQVNDFAKDDDAVLNMYVVVDRHDIVELELDSKGVAIVTESIGDYIMFKLGVDTEHDITIDTSTLETLKNSTDSGSVLFRTNRTKVQADVPIDKYATATKLKKYPSYKKSNDNTTGQTNAIIQNESIYKLYVSLIKATNNSRSRYEKDDFVVKDNEIINSSLISKFEEVKVEQDEQDVSLSQILSLVKNGTYILHISTKQYDTGLDENIEYYENNKFASTTQYIFEIKHEQPSGNYVTYESENKDSKMSLTISSGTAFDSVNKDALTFEFEDYDNKYHAEIDPNNFTVMRKKADGTGLDETIFECQDGQYIVSQSISSNWDLSGIEGSTENEKIKTYIEEYIFNKVQKNNATTDENKLYRYSIHIFNAHDNIARLSDRDEDYIYSVYIHYKGKEADYEENTYSVTYTIHQDTTAPSLNLNKLKEMASQYVENVDETNYFFAIDKTEKVLTSTDFDESKELYLKHILSLEDFTPTLLPGDENFGSLSVNADSFNPSSVDANKFEQVTLNTQTKDDWYYDLSEFEGYYELFELDTAKNITRYYVYISQNGTSFVNIDYDICCDESNPQNDKMLKYDDDFDKDKIESQISLAKLTGLEFFYIEDDNFAKIDENVVTSEQDFYTYTDNAEPPTTKYYTFDKFITIFIKSQSGTVLETYTCDAFNETMKDFLSRVVTGINKLQNKSDDFTFTVEILNRFGDNHTFELLFPGPELDLTIVDYTDHFEVSIPETANNVKLVSFIVKQADVTKLIELNVDSYNNNIISRDDNGLLAATYKFGQGSFSFVIKDNYGRTKTIPKYYATTTDDKHSFSFGAPTVTKYDEDDNEIIHTKNDVSFVINDSIWSIKIYYGETLEQLKAATELTKNYSRSAKPNDKLKYTYTFVVDGYYKVVKVWGIDESVSNEEYYFCISKSKPTVNVVFDSGITSQQLNDGSTYSENITLIWHSDYDISGQIVCENNGSSTSTSIDSDMEELYITQNGNYTVVLTDALGNTYEAKFKKTDAKVILFTVWVDGQPVVESYSTREFIDGDDTSVYYYYVKYDGSTFSDNPTEDMYAEVRVMPEANKGINCEQTESAYDTDSLTGTTSYHEYKILSTNNNDNLICVLRVVFVPTTSNFAGVSIVDNSSATISVSESSATNYTASVTVKFNEKSVPTGTTDNAEFYAGNTTQLLHYYDGELLEIVKGGHTLTMTRSGHHRIVIMDMCGNVQKFGDKEYFDLYLINSIIYRINEELPINNCFYNDEVKLSVMTKLGDSDTIYEVMATATRNGAEISDFALDADGCYTFSTPGYYTITLNGTVPNNTSISFEQQFNFTIINQNVAMIAFNVPTSYGFSINKIYKNQANMSDLLTDKSTLWLAAGDGKFGAGVFTIMASYFDSSLGKTLDFSFKVWINEETPTIMPVNYTYGTKTSKVIKLQYNGAVIYSQIGLGYIKITNQKGSVISTINIDEQSTNEVMEISFNKTGEYTVALYNNEGKLISSYKVVKTTPLNSSAKLIIIIVSGIAIALTVVFIFLRRKLKFR